MVYTNRILAPGLLGLAALVGCKSVPLPEPTATESTIASELEWDELTLGPNDVVRVGVYGHPELSTPLTNQLSGTRVDPDGTLSLPLVGTVAIGGLALPAAREVITAAYSNYVNEPRVDVSVVEYAARRFYLYGEVKEPGPYTLDRPITAYQALSMGGGYTSKALRDGVVLMRGTPEDLEVYQIDAEHPDTSGLVAIRPDDFLFVRRSGPGRFSDDVLPILQGISSSLASVATVFLIEESLD